MDLNTYINIFDKFAKYSMDDNKLNEVAGIFKDQLNSDFTSDRPGEEIVCRKVFISRGDGTDVYPIAVIPIKPTSKILSAKFLGEYEVDINVSAFNYGKEHDSNTFSSKEVVAWLIHEMYANIMTDETYIRFKKMVIKHYDTRNSNVLGAFDAYGMLAWIDIFSRTRKGYTFNNLTEVNLKLKELGLDEAWDSALLKYISANGGDERIIYKDQVKLKDKSAFTLFNQLARKYASNHMQYNNTDYDTQIKYMLANIRSELARYYLTKEPLVTPTHMEKDTFLLFDDNRLLYESACCDDGTVKATTLADKVDEVKKELPYVHSAYDKIMYDAKVNELETFISDKKESTVGDTEFYDNLAFELDGVKQKAEEKESNLSVSVRELE